MLAPLCAADSSVSSRSIASSSAGHTKVHSTEDTGHGEPAGLFRSNELPFTIGEHIKPDRFGHVSVNLGALLLLVAFLLGVLTKLLLHSWQEKSPLPKKQNTHGIWPFTEWKLASDDPLRKQGVARTGDRFAPTDVQNLKGASKKCAEPLRESPSEPSYVGGRDFMHSIDFQLAGIWLDAAELDFEPKRRGPITIGRGSSETLRLAQWRQGQQVVIKVLSHPPDPQERFLKRMAQLKRCRSPHIVHFLGAYVANGKTMLVTECMEGGDLHTRLQQDSERKVFNGQRKQEIALGIASALKFLHARGIVDLNLKSSNILLTADLSPKIDCIGMGKGLHSLDSTPHSRSTLWASPEQLMGEPCGLPSDVWALGTILSELYTGEAPTERRCCRIAAPAEASKELQDLIDSCHVPKPECRPSAADVYTILQAAKF